MKGHVYREKKTVCISYEDIDTKANLTLGPLLVSFCLLASGMSFSIYLRVGDRDRIKKEQEKVTETTEEVGLQAETKIKIPWGAILGGIQLLIVLGLTVWYIWSSSRARVNGRGSMPSVWHTIYLCELIILTLMNAFAMIPGFYLNSKAKLSHMENNQSETILSISLGGVYVLIFMLLFSCFKAHDKITDDALLSEVFKGVASLFLLLLEASFQYIFILDVLRRERKTILFLPTKQIVIFIIFCNWSLWCVTTFQTDETSAFLLQVGEFDKLSSLLIVYLIHPFLMYYRFRSCLCLMDVIGHTLSNWEGRKSCCKIWRKKN